MDKKQIIKKFDTGESLFITNNFSRMSIKYVFYNMSGKIRNKAEYFRTRYRDIVWGDYLCYVKFNHGEFIDFLMLSANSGYASPQMLTIGSVVNDKIHLVRETLPLPNGHAMLFEIDTKYFEEMKIREIPEARKWDIGWRKEPTDEEVRMINTATDAKRRILRTMNLSDVFK